MIDPDLRQRLIHAIPIPAIILDRGFQIEAANQSAETLFATKLEATDFIRVLRQPAALACLKEVLSTRQQVLCKLILNQQTPRTYQACAAPLWVSGNHVQNILFTLQDISAEIDAEKSRSTFVANVSHELRSPLTALIGAVETLKGPARNDQKARDKFLDMMQKEAERMSRLVADLLSLSKLEAKEHLPPNQRVDLLKIIQAVEQSLSASKPAYTNRIHIKTSTKTTKVDGDQDELIEVFQNLIENALKYSRPNTPVTISLNKKTKQLAVHIKDIGEGIEAEHIPRLTERFYRIDKGRSRKIGGTGLGLAITKHILNRHRAKLLISSKLGAGTTVSVMFKQ